jgi:nucleotide-binding universal stress UspA family protein
MKPAAPKNRVVWAVDPFCKECFLVKQTAIAISRLAKQWSAQVEPVYILGDVPPNVRLLPMLVRDVQSQAQIELCHILKGIPTADFLDLCLITSRGSQLRDQADSVIEYAKQAKASMIAVGTRARSGPKRWFMGSFAETLISRSDVPLYVINPIESVPKTLKNILFATDFSDESKAAFKKVIRLAKDMGASITVFHKVKYELTPSVEVAFKAYPYYRDAFRQEVQARQKEANLLSGHAKRAGVKTEVVVDYLMNGSVAQVIIDKARKRRGIIALAAHSGPLASAILGSTARQVARTAECPVWVIHTEHRKAEDKPFNVTEKDIISDLTEHGGLSKRTGS